MSNAGKGNISSVLREMTAMWADNKGAHIAIPLDIVVQVIAQPLIDQGLNPTIEVDAVRNRIVFHFSVSDIKKLISVTTANDPSKASQLSRLFSIIDQLSGGLGGG
jgi:hypothetical protein